MSVTGKFAGHGWSVYSGRDRIGNVELRKGKFVAVDTKGRIVGKFATLHEAFSGRRRKANEPG